MWGYWSHCFYSCKADSYDEYVNLKKKQPPVGEFDKNFHKIPCQQAKEGRPINFPFDSDMESIIKDLVEVWTLMPSPSYAKKFYNFSFFTMSLNQLKSEFEKLIPPTDSRLRPDLKQLEIGNLGK